LSADRCYFAFTPRHPHRARAPAPDNANRVLCQKRRQKPDFGPDPFALDVRLIRSVIATPAAAELRAEVRTLNLIKLLDLLPGFVADRSGDINC